MKNYIKCASIALIWGILQSMSYLKEEGSVRLSDIILQSSISSSSIVPAYLIEETLKMMPFFMFQILFGTLIYQHFCTASVYYFSRCTAKIPWFLKETRKILFLAITYNILVLAVTVGAALIFCPIQMDEVGIILAVYLILIQSLWLFFTSIAMNLLAIKFGSQNGFMIVMIIQVALITLLLLWQNILPVEDSAQVVRNGFLLKWNLISHLFLNWHSSQYPEVNRLIHNFDFSFDLNLSVLVLFCACAVMVCIGCFVIRRYDLIVLDAEDR